MELQIDEELYAHETEATKKKTWRNQVVCWYVHFVMKTSSKQTKSALCDTTPKNGGPTGDPQSLQRHRNLHFFQKVFCLWEVTLQKVLHAERDTRQNLKLCSQKNALDAHVLLDTDVV